MKVHEKYIKRCIQLAKNGIGQTYPNPMVGSVVVHEGKIIGEGWHQKAGDAHAEVRAIHQVMNEELLSKSTIYVSLEPCSHFGKTPPCSDLIIAKGIKDVVIGTVDPFAKVAGNGIKKLMEAGCNVTVGVLEKDCQELNKRFFTFHQKQRPYIIIKFARTKDNFIAPENQYEKEPVWISNAFSKQWAHRLRAREQAILVGTNTALKDNPSLSTRLWYGEHPIKVLIDAKLKVDLNSAIFKDNQKVLVFTEEPKKANTQKHIEYFKIDFKKNVPEQITKVLYANNIQSLIVEGGTRTINSFIASNLWDETFEIIGAKKFESGIVAPKVKGNLKKEFELADNLIKLYVND